MSYVTWPVIAVIYEDVFKLAIMTICVEFYIDISRIQSAQISTYDRIKIAEISLMSRMIDLTTSSLLDDHDTYSILKNTLYHNKQQPPVSMSMMKKLVLQCLPLLQQQQQMMKIYPSVL